MYLTTDIVNVTCMPVPIVINVVWASFCICLCFGLFVPPDRRCALVMSKQTLYTAAGIDGIAAFNLAASHELWYNVSVCARVRYNYNGK